MSFESRVRRIVPSVPPLTRRGVLMGPLDALDRLISRPFGLSRRLPPNRLRLRVGASNRLLFNQFQHLMMPVDFWLHAFAAGHVGMSSRILDLGCGCGRYAATLRDYSFEGESFGGRYTGVDVDPEMIAWCRGHFPADRFEFLEVEGRSSVYRPAGEAARSSPLPLADAGQDFVFAISLLTHLLEDDVRHYLAEAARVMAPGATATLSVFCVEHLAGRLGGRWTFRHRAGSAMIESRRYPEAAVAYSADDLAKWASDAGLASPRLVSAGDQSLLVAQKQN